MKKVFWVIEGKLAGRPGPVMAPWDLFAIRSAGITTIVSADDRCEPEKVAAMSFVHVCLFMPAVFPTTPALVGEFASRMEEAVPVVVDAVRRGEVVMVHCYAGQDRTGLILCGALMELQGLTANEAFERVKRVQPYALSSPGIKDVLDEYVLRKV